MKKFIIIILVIFVALNVFGVDADLWYIDLDAGSYITPQGSTPFINTEAMYEEDWWRVGGEVELTLKDWGIKDAGIFAKTNIYGHLANIYGEIGVGVGLVSDISTIKVKYKPNLKIMVDFGDFVFETEFGILIEDKLEKDNIYLSIGVQKRFFKELQ